LNKVIGIFGGTFDPPHWGHIKLAAHFAKLLKLDELIWLPSGEPWQKSLNITSANDRYAMTIAAAEVLKQIIQQESLPIKISVSRLEIDRKGPSYTIDSAKALRQQYGSDTALIWLMGADSFLQLPTWNQWDELIQLIHIAVASRPPYSIKSQLTTPLIEHYKNHQTPNPEKLSQQVSGLIYLDEELAVDLASSQLRVLLEQNKAANAIQDWIPAPVMQIIVKKGLYQSKVR
jgi:nicotinate-nucleotide adenylyltransferase